MEIAGDCLTQILSPDGIMLVHAHSYPKYSSRHPDADKRRANAAFIVKAVNAHEALVGFVQEIADMSPSTFERGDNPAFLIDAAKAALKALALTSADRATVGGEK